MNSVRKQSPEMLYNVGMNTVPDSSRSYCHIIIVQGVGDERAGDMV